jgi:malonate transporter and related proteins
VLAQLTGNVVLTLPVFVPISVGVFLRHGGFLPEAFWPQLERLTYSVLLPALIANAIATSRLDALDPGPILWALALALMAMTAMLYAIKWALRLDGPAFASLFHGCIRPNGYMGIATCLAILGPAALPQISLVVAAWVPIGLVLSIVIFVREAAGGPVTAGALARRLLGNPLIASVAAGLVLNWIGIGPFLAQVPLLDVLGRAAVAMGLLAVGAGLDLAALRSAGRALVASIVLGLLAMPALMAGIAHGIALDGVGAAALILFAAMPTSPSGFVLASQMKADAGLMAAIIALQTVSSVLTISAVATVLI